MTFGMPPREPHAGYGYIERGDSIDSGFTVKSFKEKPNQKLAVDYFSNRKATSGIVACLSLDATVFSKK